MQNNRCDKREYGPLPKAKTKHREKESYRDLLTDTDAEKISRICEKEIDYFGYKFNSESETNLTSRSGYQSSNLPNHRKKDRQANNQTT